MITKPAPQIVNRGVAHAACLGGVKRTSTSSTAFRTSPSKHFGQKGRRVRNHCDRIAVRWTPNTINIWNGPRNPMLVDRSMSAPHEILSSHHEVSTKTLWTISSKSPSWSLHSWPGFIPFMSRRPHQYPNGWCLGGFGCQIYQTWQYTPSAIIMAAPKEWLGVGNLISGPCVP